MLSLLLFLFAPAADALGSPRFAAREAATRVLAVCWPASEPALAYAGRSPDPEVAHRAGLARRRGIYRLLGPDGRHRLDAVALVCDPHEVAGLPWARTGDAEVVYGRPALREALAALAVHCRWAATSDPLGRPCWYEHPAGVTGRFAGLDDLRFRARGLTPPSDWWARPFGVDSAGDAALLWASWKGRGPLIDFPPK